MTLAELMRTEKYQNDWHQLRANLLFVAANLRLEINELLEVYDLTQQQFNALRIIRGAGETLLTTHEIRERLLDKSSDVSRLTDRLENKGWVVKKPCTQDKRLVRVALTPAGVALLHKVDDRMGDIDALLQTITTEEARQLNELLGRLAQKYRPEAPVC